jgi:uncharacterized protein HemY
MARSPVKSAEKLSPESLNPQSAQDFTSRGWLYYGQQDYSKAQGDFRRALDMKPDDADTLYALGLSLAAGGDPVEAERVFEKTLLVLDAVSDHVRASMLRRLVNGHINRIRTGDWNLER